MKSFILISILVLALIGALDASYLLYGLVAYLLFGLLALYELVQKKQTGTMKPLAYFSGLGVLAFVYFVYLQFFVIKALCLYCLVSALVMALIFALSVAYNVKYSKNPGV